MGRPSSTEAAAPPRRDPLLWLGALAALGLHARVLFAAEHLPLVDWPVHVGLISILAHGGESGALAYFVRSWAPNPYALFYWTSALLAQVLPVVTAAKLALLFGSAGLLAGAASLARALGGEPRLALLAPMGFFGQAYGFGFASFCFTLPLALWCWAELEWTLRSASDPTPGAERRWARLAAAAALVYLGHALVFLAVVWVTGVRLLVHIVSVRTGRRRAALAVTLGLSPAFLLGVIRVGLLLRGPSRITETTPGDEGPFLDFPAWAERWSTLRWNLLDRGSEAHLAPMYAVVIMFLALASIGLLQRARGALRPATGLRFGRLAVVAGVVGLYALGPDSILRPFGVWLFYSRFATLAAIVIFIAVPVRLRGPLGPIAAAAMLGLVAWDAALQRGHVERHGPVAAAYDGVRRVVPEGARVLALGYGLPPDDPVRDHSTLRKLAFYHLADGAAYVNGLFDNPLIPVQYRDDVERPRAPFWRTPQRFDPSTHGRDYDVLVLRGAPVESARASAHHRLVAEVRGWFVFETVPPPAWPSPR